ncbi:hypothetical protein BRARA_I00842 [Brassica rapa]|uniref:CCHC-type domain-containing protein n=1 Tax=Brassica campestris TaxID=3711 RepID=A0A397Y0J5_BRACM|nr:hypothetical protein BRARA_I00842 [Brassica rapa]
MTKKKKPKGSSASGSPSASASSESSRSQSSAPTSSDLAVEVTSDPTDLVLPGVSSLAKTKSQSVVENGAVTATNFDGAFEIPSSDHDGAVTATNVDGDLESPVSELLGAVTVTNVDGALETLVSETSGAVTATIVDGTIETPASEPSGVVTATNVDGAHVISASEPSGAVTATLEEGEFVPPVSVTPATPQTVPVDKTQTAKLAANHWRQFVKTTSQKLDPVGTPFTLESGEACIKIPNSVIEKNKKSWDSFILGQFYEEPPARGAVHNIVNGIWSKQKRDISVSKMEGHAFLFRVPCPHARRRILRQCLWQIDGQTMFVAKWAPGVQAEKPELTTVPVWLDFTGVPLQFFNRDALKEIAGLVGHPICLHPSTENLTNIEVAKVYTVIDPRKPLPEAVNAQFENGEVVRIQVSSPWLPSLCGHCLKVGHTVSKCPNAPPKCSVCGSVKHSAEECTRLRTGLRKDKAPIANELPIVDIPPPSQANPVRTRAPTEHAQPHRSGGKLNSSKSNSGHSMKHQSSNGSALPSAQKSLIFVDLNATGLSSSRNSTQGTDTDLDSGLESSSADEDDPTKKADRFIEVMSRKMKKSQRSLRKAGARGSLNL